MLKTNITDALYQYTLDIGMHEPEVARQLREYTVTHFKNHQMLSTPEQCQFMALLAKLMNAKCYLEIGVFTGYSTLVMALALKINNSKHHEHEASNYSGIEIVALDNSKPHLDIATQFWQKAQVNDIITPICNDALQTLSTLYETWNKSNKYFDIAYIDANKADYLAYYEYAYKLVRAGGIILVDNILMGGQVINEASSTPKYVKYIKEFNQFIYADTRVNISVLPIGDGLTIAYKL